MVSIHGCLFNDILDLFKRKKESIYLEEIPIKNICRKIKIIFCKKLHFQLIEEDLNNANDGSINF